MVWISQLIDQDVNVFNGAALLATSERDLFASGLLPTRTPDAVYRAIVLQRLPSFVTEDRDRRRPLHAGRDADRESGTRNAVLTVPLALPAARNRARDRRSGSRRPSGRAVLHPARRRRSGCSMAERIADPVRQLTRATRHIARGDFDARIAVRSSDELRRLVDAFNGMAAELKAQRDQLERTHRLEAWAEMARQVAHEIKNPLTPIQLSAEHLRACARRPRRAARAGPRGLRDVDPRAGHDCCGRSRASSPASPRRRPRGVQPSTPRRSSTTSSSRIASVSTGGSQIDTALRRHCRRCSSIRTLVARALANIVENALHAMPGQGTPAPRARAWRARGSWSTSKTPASAWTRKRSPCLRTLLLDQDDRHGARPADRAAQHRAERRIDRGARARRARARP